MTMRQLIPPLLAAVAIAALTPAAYGAADVYRQTLPDGRVVYSDKPIPGHPVERVIKADPSPVRPVATDPRTAPPRPVATMPPAPAGTASREKAQELRANRERAAQQVLAAEAALEQATKAMEAGKEPLANERSPNPNGTTRLNEAYTERQAKLKRDVDAAAAEVIKAHDLLGRSR